MPEGIRVLIIEDDPADADLMVLALQRGGFAPDWDRVETESDYLSRLHPPPDIILSDSSLPGFDGLRALELLQHGGLDIPFILVSGRVGEDLAVDAMKRGASDYLLKDRLARLGEAVRRAIEQARLRRERAWAIEALRRSEDRYRRLVEADVVGIALTDGEHFLEANNYLLKMLGYSREEFESGAIRWLEITPPEYREMSDRAFRQLVETGTCPAFEKEYLARDGRRVPVLIGSVALGGAAHPQFLSYVIDLTERKQLEEQFRQAQKLESFGQLAGGIAHDFNNLLTVITGYSSMIMEEIPPHHHLRGAIEQVSEAARRSSELTRQLLTFSRRQPTQARPIVLNHVVRDIEKMLRRLIGEDIQLKLALSAEEAVIRADPGQIEQVIVNLAVNARDAMPQGGALLIETQLIPGPHVVLVVHDEGEGMTPEIQERIFEPFFTTKEPGKGTGLGLSTVYGIVRQSGGAISVASEPGGGSMFKVLFPSLDTAAEPVEMPSPCIPQGGSETILVAEDEEGVRSYVRHVLEQSGYVVLEAPNGRVALELAARYPDPIHLFLSDVVMPEGGGVDLAKQFLQIRPGVPVLRMSGYADRAGQAAILAAGAYMQKPFTASALLNQIRSLLDNTTCVPASPITAADERFPK